MRIKSTIFCLFLSHILLGQIIKKTYYNVAWQELKDGHDYKYYSTFNKLSNKYSLTKYFNTGEVLMTGNYLDLKLEKPDGEFIWYYKNGNTRQKQSYSNAKLIGERSYYYSNGNLFRTETIFDKTNEVKSYYGNGNLKFEGKYFNDNKNGEIIFYHLNGQIYYRAQFDNTKNISECEFFDESGAKLNSNKCINVEIEERGSTIINEEPFIETGQEIDVSEFQEYNSFYARGIASLNQKSYKNAAYDLEVAARINPDTLLLSQTAFAFKLARNTSKYVYYLSLASMYGSQSAHADIVKAFDYLSTAKINYENSEETVKFDASQMAYSMKVKTYNGEYTFTKLFSGATEYKPSNDVEIFNVVELMPEFPGGTGSFLKYIAENTKYPEIASRKNIQGRVIVTFIVSEEGKIENARIVKGIHESLDNEAIRVVNSMPLWKPGMHNGKPVKVKMVVPIKFGLN